MLFSGYAPSTYMKNYEGRPKFVKRPKSHFDILELVIKELLTTILRLATATHNKWGKMIHICLISDQTFSNLDV